MVRSILSQTENHKRSALSVKLGIPPTYHNAGSDSTACAYTFKEFVDAGVDTESYADHKFFSFGVFWKQLAVWNRQYNVFYASLRMALTETGPFSFSSLCHTSLTNLRSAILKFC